MQILAISDVYYPRECEVSVGLRTLLRELSAKGHAITLIAPDYPGAVDMPGEDIIRVSSRPLRVSKLERAMKMHRLMELTERLRSWNYDIVHVHTPYIAHAMGIALARRLHIPVVETLSAFYDESIARYVPRLRSEWRRTLARAATHLQSRGLDGLVVRATGMRDRLRGYGIDKPVTVISPSVDALLFQSGDGARFRAAHNIEPDRPVILCGSLLQNQGAAAFLLAVLEEIRREVPNILMLVPGEGSSKAQWQADADRRDLRRNIALVGSLDRAKGLRDCYNAADCLVFPANDETEGTVLLEAMAAGLPVVAAASARTKDMLSADGPALVAEPTVADFVTKVLHVLHDQAVRTHLATAGRQYAQRWSASVSVEQLLDCYREAITLHNRPMRALARRSL